MAGKKKSTMKKLSGGARAGKAEAKDSKSIEQSLWDTANKLRGSVESSEYKHVVLSLIFLKFVSDKGNYPEIPGSSNGGQSTGRPGARALRP